MTELDIATTGTVWGIHNDTLTEELVHGGFVSLGWNEITDLRASPLAREPLKEELSRSAPEATPNAVAGWAGVLYRFGAEVAVGDVIVAPYRPDSTINLGIVSGSYYYEADAPDHRHRLPVRWVKIGLARTVFSQSALYEIGSAITLFKVRRHKAEFLAALDSAYDSNDELADVVDTVLELPEEQDDTVEEPRASRIERHTRDFILEVLTAKLGPQEFEEFTADLLRAVGYQARVTNYSQDGGVDVIAHHDPLGIEPPQIKVQCKHTTSTIGSPAVQQLIGVQGMKDLVLFVTLGAYSKDARMVERQHNGMRLLSGEDVVTLVLENYNSLPERWRSLMPLTPVLVVSDAAG